VNRTTDICPWLDGEIADSRWMDRDGGAQVAPHERCHSKVFVDSPFIMNRLPQVAPHELCTKLVEAALAAGASLRIGAVEGIEKSGGDASAGASVSAVVIDGERSACCAVDCNQQ